LLAGGRQSLKNGILIIRKEAPPDSPATKTVPTDRTAPRKSLPAFLRAFLRPGPLIQSDHPLIVAKAAEITAAGGSDAQKAKRLVNWVYEKVRKRPVLSVPDALSTLNNLVGDCNEHAVLLTALARAAGIPAEMEAGLVYLRGRFYYHAWNILYVGGAWVTADAVFGQMPADVTHIRFVRGSTEQQMDLLGLIGRMQLEVVKVSANAVPEAADTASRGAKK
jgi:transglutaminase-like putative cysteine protease